MHTVARTSAGLIMLHMNQRLPGLLWAMLLHWWSKHIFLVKDISEIWLCYTVVLLSKTNICAKIVVLPVMYLWVRHESSRLPASPAICPRVTWSLWSCSWENIYITRSRTEYLEWLTVPYEDANAKQLFECRALSSSTHKTADLHSFPSCFLCYLKSHQQQLGSCR